MFTVPRATPPPVTASQLLYTLPQDNTELSLYDHLSELFKPRRHRENSLLRTLRSRPVLPAEPVVPATGAAQVAPAEAARIAAVLRAALTQLRHFGNPPLPQGG